MTHPLRVFVNGAGVDVAPGATALDAVRAWNPDVAAEVERGDRIVTDSRGLPAPLGDVLQAGAIFRLVPNRGGPASRGPDDGAGEAQP